MHCRGKQPCPSILRCHLHNDAFHRHGSMRGKKSPRGLSLNLLNDVPTTVRLFHSTVHISLEQQTAHYCTPHIDIDTVVRIKLVATLDAVRFEQFSHSSNATVPLQIIPVSIISQAITIHYRNQQISPFIRETEIHMYGRLSTILILDPATPRAGKVQRLSSKRK